MAMNVNGIRYSLIDDCDTLCCKLENAAYEAEMERDYDKADRLSEDLEALEQAVSRHDTGTMQAILNKYFWMFKRYR